jgi:hypothetical protein
VALLLAARSAGPAFGFGCLTLRIEHAPSPTAPLVLRFRFSSGSILDEDWLDYCYFYGCLLLRRGTEQFTLAF